MGTTSTILAQPLAIAEQPEELLRQLDDLLKPDLLKKLLSAIHFRENGRLDWQYLKKDVLQYCTTYLYDVKADLMEQTRNFADEVSDFQVLQILVIAAKIHNTNSEEALLDLPCDDLFVIATDDEVTGFLESKMHLERFVSFKNINRSHTVNRSISNNVQSLNLLVEDIE